MQTIEGLKRKIQSTDDLQSVVKTMKALAAVNIRQYERAVDSLKDYNRAVEMGLRVVLRDRPEFVATCPPMIDLVPLFLVLARGWSGP